MGDARRYTFGNDEFSLESAYHDCKLVFDGITDDDSFQEADAGLILHYANEIIYALQEAIEGKNTNVPTNDLISREDTIREIIKRSATDFMDVEAIATVIHIVNQMPSVEVPRWISCAERLPDKNDFYLVWVGQPWLIPRFRWVDKAYYCDGKWLGIQEDVKVFAWLPLPQYESEEE